MKVFTCTDHDTHWPVGGASVVVAETETKARKLLAEALKASKLESSKFSLQELDLTKEHAIVLDDGQY